MTKIFITIPWFVPAFRAGGPVQSVANLVKEFTEEVEYFIFTSDTDLNGAALENVVTGEWVSFNADTHVWYAGPEKISDTLVKQVELQKPDVLFIIGLFSWHFNMVPLVYCKAPKKILSARGMLHPGALSQKSWKKKIYLSLFRLLEYHYKVSFHATDEEEKKFIFRHFGTPANIFIAGNFPNKMAPLPVVEKKTRSLKLISVALISPMKNILLVLEALENLQYAIEYDVYGPVKDEAYFDVCKAKIKSFSQNIKVNFHREIEPRKVKEVLSKAHVFILPSKSENFGHAIFEALSAARPVITSNNTPWNQLKEFQAGINVPTESIDELIKAISFFAEMDEIQMEKWSDGAYLYSEKMVEVSKIKEQYRVMFESK